ncbi:MAG: DUF4417 domain-containing protein [Thermoguttaceae bacterium]|nr:DUF4417 domain-containing protein [Thermoguttaceae bacterium]
MSSKDCIQTDFFGKIYAPDAETIRVGNFDFPVLPPQQLHPDPHALPINYITSKMTARMLRANWFHCHVDDRHFEKYWNNLDQYKPTITQAGGVIGPDFSVYRNFSVERQMYNVYRNRVLAYAITQVNPNLIPAAPFGGEETWDWCFLGLPKNSTVSITTNGVLSDPEAMRLFVGGVDELVRQLEPYGIAVCGTIPEWLWTKYPGVRIFPVDNFNQMRRRQMKSSPLIRSATIKWTSTWVTVTIPYPFDPKNVGGFRF